MKLYYATVLILFTVSLLIIPVYALSPQKALLIADDSLTPRGGIILAPIGSSHSTWFVDPEDLSNQPSDIVTNGTHAFFVYQGFDERPTGISIIEIDTRIETKLQNPSDSIFDEETTSFTGIAINSTGFIFISATTPDPQDPGNLSANIGSVYLYDNQNQFVKGFYDQFIFPQDVTIAPNGDVWVLDTEANNIFRINQNTDHSEPIPGNPSLNLLGASQMIFTNSTTVAVTNNLNVVPPFAYPAEITLFNINTGTNSSLISSTDFGFLYGIELDSGLLLSTTDDTIYFGDQFSNLDGLPTIYSMSASGGPLTVIAKDSPLTLPVGIALTSVSLADANLILEKSGPQFIADGHSVNYTITISNDGPDEVSDAFVTDIFPTGLDYVGSEPPSACTQLPVPNTVVCNNLGTIPANGAVEVILTFDIGAFPLSFPLINTASVATTAVENNVVDNEDSTEILGKISGDYCGKDIKDYTSVILGTDSNDNLVGTNNDDLIIGLKGDDTIDGLEGNDCLIGDDTNNPSIQGQDTINGGLGNDEIHGGPDSDNLYGNDGDDTIFGDDAGDFIYGGTGIDLIRGGGGDDKLFGEQDNDTIFGDDGNDIIDGGTEIDTCNEGGQQLGTVTFCEADLSVTISGTPDPVTSGGLITYTISVRNIGPSNATNLSIPITLDPTLTFNSLISSGLFTCIPTLPSGPISCSLIELDHTDPVQIISFSALTTSSGIVTSSVTSSSDFVDQNSSNDAAQAQTTVTPVVTNTPPIAINDVFTVLQDSTNNNFNVLANDTDADNDTLFVSSVSTPSNGGTAVINGTNNGIIYTPAPGYFGPETFTYFATDGQATSLPATITVTVKQTFCGLPESAFDHVISGTPGNDNIVGTQDNDLIFGLAGNDKIKGLKGDDCIFGGDGDDKINGNKGNDTIFGGDGDDKINGNKGNDTIFGGDGDDDIKGNNGDDMLSGDEGNDKIYGGNGDDFIDGGNQIDKCKGGKGNNTIINCEEKPKEKEDKQKDDKSDCDCKKPSIFTVSLSGTSSAESVEIYSKENYVGNDDKILTELDIDGTNIVINSEDDLNQNNLESNTVYRILDSDGNEIDVVSIHTSCSQPLYVGQQFTGQNHIITLTVVSGTDLDGNSSIPDDQCKVKDDDKKEVKEAEEKAKKDKEEADKKAKK